MDQKIDKMNKNEQAKKGMCECRGISFLLMSPRTCTICKQISFKICAGELAIEKKKERKQKQFIS